MYDKHWKTREEYDNQSNPPTDEEIEKNWNRHYWLNRSHGYRHRKAQLAWARKQKHS